MSQFYLQQNVVASSDEARGMVSMSDLRGPVVCPKPRRVGILANNPVRPLRWQLSHQADGGDLSAGAELLDIILKKLEQEDHGAEKSASQVASSPPYFCGSPPVRAANPLIRDAQFRDEKVFQNQPSPSSMLSPSAASARKGGGCVRMNFGFKPAAVRVEGFDCLNRDRQNSSIPAMA
ncbi:unnamed protein product [Linum tenue]|uniref:Uncharacterized protein n=1 Tax=Linum tenue TaxID=586396 RepID=A0AAV0MYN4_9ROSI|nr:unnamed protein product [Linum tenue]CAI0451363.1 unnamed protein product [Linum tenue]